jgi:hypothetical protein
LVVVEREPLAPAPLAVVAAAPPIAVDLDVASLNGVVAELVSGVVEDGVGDGVTLLREASADGAAVLRFCMAWQLASIKMPRYV